MTDLLQEHTPGRIWLHEFPVRYGGCHFEARMTVLRLHDGRLMIHSPYRIDPLMKGALDDLGEVALIVAPGNFHHLYVASCQSAFPAARTFLCPTLEKKRPDLSYDGLLTDEPQSDWAEDLDQAVVRGGRVMTEVAFLHRQSQTLILVDSVEYIGDSYAPKTNGMLRLFWHVMGMWNRPRPAPEYRFFWRDREAARQSFERILAWDFQRVILAHGELIEQDAKRLVREAWSGILK